MTEKEVWVKITNSNQPSKKVLINTLDKKKEQLNRDLKKLKDEFGVFAEAFIKALISLSKSIFYAFSVLGTLIFIWGAGVKKKDTEYENSLEGDKNVLRKL